MLKVANVTCQGKMLTVHGQETCRAGAKPARQFSRAMQIFLCLWTIKELISKEMNNDNDLNLHSMTKLSGWLCYCCRGNSLIGKMLLRTWPNYCELLQIGAHIKWLVIFLILYSESLGANVLCMTIGIWSNSRPGLWVPSSLCIRKSSVFFKFSGFLEPETLTSMAFSVLTGSLPH